MADTGLILKGVGGFYTVLSDNGTEIVCRALRKVQKGRHNARGGR